MVAAVDILHATAGDRLAVVGVGVDFPACQDLEGFFHAIYTGQSVIAPNGAWNSAGSLSRAAAGALQSAGLDQNTDRETGILVVGSRSEINALHHLDHLNGPLMDFAGYNEALPAMLAQAYDWLEAREVEAVLLAGCASGEVAANANPRFGFDRTVHASQPGQGAVAIALMRLTDAQRWGKQVYAVLEAVAFSEQPNAAISAQEVEACARQALQTAGISPDSVGYLAALASGEDAIDRIEVEGLCKVYRGDPLSTAIGSVQAIAGSLESINGLAGLAQAVLCLAHRLRPGVTGWTGSKSAQAWAGSLFYVPVESLTWFDQETSIARIAAINLLGQEGSCGHVILGAVPENRVVEPVMRKPELAWIPIQGNTPDQIVDQLEKSQSALHNGQPLADLAQQAYHSMQLQQARLLTVILARTSTEAQREIEFAMRGIPAAVQKGQDWQTPGGSYFTPQPLGGDSQIAFVYPGAFNSYLGMGKELFTVFPSLYESFQKIAPQVGEVWHEDLLYPRSLEPLTREQLDPLESELIDDPFSMMTSGTSLSVGLSGVLRDIFHVKPACALGYSLGENSMLFSLGVWGDGLHASQKLFHSELFHSRVAGPQNAVREHWGQPLLDANANPAEPLWENFLLMAPPERVRTVLEEEPHVYLTHINTPRQVVIGGDPAACRRVIERVKCSSLKAPFNYVLHCEAMESEYQALYDIHSLPTHPIPDIRLYSAADNRPFTQTQAEIARAVAHDLCTMLDFPRLVETVYAGGARIFIELGAGSNCAKWIDEILRGRSILSMSANRKGVDDTTSILRVLARLACHQVSFDLSPLFEKQVMHV